MILSIMDLAALRQFERSGNPFSDPQKVGF